MWRSDDLGVTWDPIATGENGPPWPARAYFQAVAKNDEIIVLGGLDYGLEENPFCALLEQGLEPPPGLGIDPDAPCPEFLPTSQFFNDVWASPDGITWEQRTDDAPGPGRADLSATVLGDHIYVLGGSRNDDTAIIGAKRTYSRVLQRRLADDRRNRLGGDFACRRLEPTARPSVRAGRRRVRLFRRGDRETFDFDDPENYLRIDDDIWRFGAQTG